MVQCGLSPKEVIVHPDGINLKSNRSASLSATVQVRVERGPGGLGRDAHSVPVTILHNGQASHDASVAHSMYRALPISRNISSSSRSLLGPTKRHLATEALPPIKKPKTLRRLVWATATATGVFYVGGTFLAFNNKQAYEFFSQNVPLGPSMLQYGEAHNWDTLTVRDILDSSKNAFYYVKRVVTEGVNGAPTSAAEGKEKVVEKAKEVKVSAAKAYRESKERLVQVAQTMHTKVEKVEESLRDKGEKALAVTKHQANQFSEGVEDLIRKAEEAIAKQVQEPLASATKTPLKGTPEQPDELPNLRKEVETTDTLSPDLSKAHDDHTYSRALPIGHELPPGWHISNEKSEKKGKAEAVLPEIPKVDLADATPEPEPLPLLAPTIPPDVIISEPIIAHLASTIDNLTSYLSTNPEASSKAKGVLTNAQNDLNELAARIEKVKEDERIKLEQSLDEQTREYTVKLLEMEMEAQDKLDSQEGEFRKLFEEERAKLVQAYREKLDGELKTQSEIINERLKQEVIAQGIELQRRWIREIKVRVEQERGGRLARLDELATSLKKLERLTVDNSAYLDENIRVHAVWTALRALGSAVDASVRRPFREELRVLRSVAVKEGTDEGLVNAVLEPLEKSDVPDIGVEPLHDLSTWFTTSVSPRVSSVALVPVSPSASPGLLSHLASHFLSSFRFKREGFVEGGDVLSVLARAEWHLGEKDLDSAAREVNQLGGTAKELVKDWLEAARRRLEVVQALEAIQAQATLASLLVL